MKTYLVADSGYYKEQLSNIAETICPNFREYEETRLEKNVPQSHLCIVIQKARKITSPVGEKNLPNWENKKA